MANKRIPSPVEKDLSDAQAFLCQAMNREGFQYLDAKTQAEIKKCESALDFIIEYLNDLAKNPEMEP